MCIIVVIFYTQLILPYTAEKKQYPIFEDKQYFLKHDYIEKRSIFKIELVLFFNSVADPIGQTNS